MLIGNLPTLQFASILSKVIFSNFVYTITVLEVITDLNGIDHFSPT